MPLRSPRRLHLAAVDQVLAHHDGLEAMLGRVLRLVGDDPQSHVALDRIVERRRGRAARDVELAGAERRHHLGGGIEADEIDVETLGLEVAALVGNEEGHVARRIGQADIELLA